MDGILGGITNTTDNISNVSTSTANTTNTEINNTTKKMNDSLEFKKNMVSLIITYFSIFVLIFLILINYYVNNPDGSIKYNFGMYDLIELAINPCNIEDFETKDMPCTIRDYINNYCKDITPVDLDFFKFAMFILNGAYIICSNYNNKLINTIGTGIYTLSSTNDLDPSKQAAWYLHIGLFFGLYLVIYNLSKLIRFGFADDLFSKIVKNKVNSDVMVSVLSILILVFSLLLIVNIGSYLTYLFWGALSSKSNKLMYVIMIIIIPFIFWITGFNLTLVEGLSNKKKKKKKKKAVLNSISGSGSKSADGSVNCTDYSYILPLIIIFIIPVIVTFKSFFTLIFTGTFGIVSIFIAEDSSQIKERIGWALIYSIIALILMFIINLIVRMLDISQMNIMK
jgi:hypothetical protein